MKVIIIGAGVAGMRVAQLLEKEGRRCKILESKPYVGGRVRSKKDERDGKMMYETGPWRIPSSHNRARRLFSDYKVALRSLKTPYPGSIKGDACSGLSTWDVNAFLSLNPSSADEADLETGYADETHAESSTSPYLVDTDTFFCADEGFSELMNRMADGLDIHLNSRVVDIVREGDQYTVKVVYRDMRRNKFIQLSDYTASTIFVCVPPCVTKEWPSFHQMAKVQTSRVEEESLHHIYGKAPHSPSLHVKDANSLLGNSISDQYGKGWFQMSYTAGRLSRFWYSLSLSYPTLFKYLLRYLVKDVMGTKTLAPYPIHSYFWPVAYHRWKAVPFFDLNTAVSSSVYPDPILLPRVYWAGEAFSSHQAWIEGALETAELAVQMMLSQKTPFPVRNCFPDEVIVKGRVIGRLKHWSSVHPGGEAAICNHIGHDVTQYFEHNGHSAGAMAMLAALQVAHASPHDDDRGELTGFS